MLCPVTCMIMSPTLECRDLSPVILHVFRYFLFVKEADFQVDFSFSCSNHFFVESLIIDSAGVIGKIEMHLF